ncbi:unnamed protein product [Amoebophrya sp. A120]|nr:unnamed protein product [Amoebophrya sp. A120]|eukprot:GSA120T00006800001.1
MACSATDLLGPPRGMMGASRRGPYGVAARRIAGQVRFLWSAMCIASLFLRPSPLASGFKIFLNKSYRSATTAEFFAADRDKLKLARGRQTDSATSTGTSITHRTKRNKSLLQQKLEMEKTYQLHAIDYSGDMYLGQHQQLKVRVLFDTGSGEFFLPSTKCDSDSCKVHPRYELDRGAVRPYSSAVAAASMANQYRGTPARASTSTGVDEEAEQGEAKNNILAIDFSKGLISGDQKKFLNVTNFLVKKDKRKHGSGGGQEREATDSQNQNTVHEVQEDAHGKLGSQKEQSGRKVASASSTSTGTTPANIATSASTTKDYQVRMNFASGSVFGQFTKDALCFEPENPASCVPDFHFLAVEKDKDVFPKNETRWGAVLGLSLPDISFGENESFLLKWWKGEQEQKKTEKRASTSSSGAQQEAHAVLPLFSMYLGPKSVDAPAVLEFGKVPPLIPPAAGRGQHQHASNTAQNENPRKIALKQDLENQKTLENLENASLGELVNLVKSMDNLNSPGNTRGAAASFDDRIIFTPVTNPGYWQLKIEDLTIGGKPLGFDCDCPTCCQAVIDSGSSVILGPKEIVKKVRQGLNYASDDNDCTNIDSFPDLGFVIRGENNIPYEFSLQDKDYMDRASEDGKDYCWLHFMDGPEDTGRGPLLILGMPFLRKFATVFQFLSGDDQHGGGEQYQVESSLSNAVHGGAGRDRSKNHPRLGFINSEYVDVARVYNYGAEDVGNVDKKSTTRAMDDHTDDGAQHVEDPEPATVVPGKDVEQSVAPTVVGKSSLLPKNGSPSTIGKKSEKTMKLGYLVHGERGDEGIIPLKGCRENC